MTTDTKPTMRPEAMEAFRYRRRLLTNQRTHHMRRLAEQIKQKGKPSGRHQRKLKQIEESIRAYNSLAEEFGLQPIR